MQIASGSWKYLRSWRISSLIGIHPQVFQIQTILHPVDFLKGDLTRSAPKKMDGLNLENLWMDPN